MSQHHLSIERVGLVTSVGLTAERSCAALRAKVTNPTETRLLDSGGERLIAHEVTLAESWRGITRLAKMSSMAIAEALADLPREDWITLPLRLCVAEPGRPGRTEGLDTDLLEKISYELDAQFSHHSGVVAGGRVAVAVALAQARTLMAELPVPRVLIVAVDSLVTWPSLSYYEQQNRLLTEGNSNGFIPGEGAGSLLIGRPSGSDGDLLCTGIGFAREAAHIGSELPFRADGLSQAIKAALADARCELRELDFRIADLSGEQYYFKEAALALSRCLRGYRGEFDLWHPAECTGEIGAVSGVAMIAQAQAACVNDYSKGPGVLIHMSNDEGERAALTLHYSRRP